MDVNSFLRRFITSITRSIFPQLPTQDYTFTMAEGYDICCIFISRVRISGNTFSENLISGHVLIWPRSFARGRSDFYRKEKWHIFFCQRKGVQCRHDWNHLDQIFVTLHWINGSGQGWPVLTYIGRNSPFYNRAKPRLSEQLGRPTHLNVFGLWNMGK